MPGIEPSHRPFHPPRWLVYVLIFGLYLTVRGYHSREGDQAYRLPLLLHRQNPALFADDPFVRAFDSFNPHRGALALLDVASRPFGLSSGLFGLFALTFAATCLGLDRLATAVWPEGESRIGIVAVGLVLVAKAGNIGTNHLFEPMLLDRQMAFALGWLALAATIACPERGWWLGPLAIIPTTLIHPSVGLQLALILGASWVVWAACARIGVSWRTAAGGLLALVLALVPGVVLNLGQGARLLDGLPLEEFRLLSVELQGPQHMLPHLWRLPQWLAWGCYFVPALLALGRWNQTSAPARTRLVLCLAVTLLGLGLAWIAVESLQHLRITLFQPFRMATLARALALVLVAGRLGTLWATGRALDRARCALLTVGLTGDWSFVIATGIDAGIAGFEAGWARFPRSHAPRGNAFFAALRQHFPGLWGRRALCITHNFGRGGWVLHPLLRERVAARPPGEGAPGTGHACREDALTRPLRGHPLPGGEGGNGWGGQPAARIGLVGNAERRAWEREQRVASWVIGGLLFSGGFWFLFRHDTESGYIPLSFAVLAAIFGGWLARKRVWHWDGKRFGWTILAAWSVPVLALACTLALGPTAHRAQPWQAALMERCRFGAVPLDDVERLAVWCRDHTPSSARFIGPPGPKTFRLWSLRNLAFNRASSPYDARGLADWFARYKDHVGFDGPAESFIRTYQTNRHELERRYQALTDHDRAALASRQGAAYVVAPVNGEDRNPNSPLELLHREGRYAVYRVRPPVNTLLTTDN